MDDDNYPYRWQVGDPPGFGGEEGVPDLPYMGYLYYIDYEDEDAEKETEEKPYNIFEHPIHLLKKAQELYEQEKYEEALYYVEHALSRHGTHDYYPDWNTKGLILEALGRYEEAKESYDKAMAISFKNNKIAKEKNDKKKWKETLNEYFTTADNKSRMLYQWASVLLKNKPENYKEKGVSLLDEAIEGLSATSKEDVDKYNALKDEFYRYR